MLTVLKVIALIVASCACALAAPPVTIGDATAYARGNYLAYLSPWGKGTKVSGIDYTEAMVLQPDSFPNTVSMIWSWPANTNGVVNFLSIAFGNYYNTVVPSPIVPQKIAHIARLIETHSFSLFGATTGVNVIDDVFLSSLAYGGTQQHEIEVLLHTPAYAAAYLRSVTSVGTYTDARGIVWTVAIDKTRLPHDILFMPSNGADVNGTVDLKAMLSYLVSTRWVSDGEYFIGMAIGAEVQQGIGSVLFNSFAVTYN